MAALRAKAAPGAGSWAAPTRAGRKKCVFYSEEEGAQPRSSVKQQPGALGEASARSAAALLRPMVSMLIPRARDPTPAPALSTPPILSSPFLLSTHSEYRGVFFRGVNYLIIISDSKASRCNIQLLKPLDL